MDRSCDIFSQALPSNCATSGCCNHEAEGKRMQDRGMPEKMAPRPNPLGSNFSGSRPLILQHETHHTASCWSPCVFVSWSLRDLLSDVPQCTSPASPQCRQLARQSSISARDECNESKDTPSSARELPTCRRATIICDASVAPFRPGSASLLEPLDLPR
jgi:hypothetical protein